MTQSLHPNPLRSFSRGFFSPFRAARFLTRHPGLLRFILIPFLINVVVFSTAIYLGLDLFHDVVVTLIPAGEAWYWSLLTPLAWLVGAAATLLLVFFGFTVVGNLLAAPFNDLLSERVEELVTGRREASPFSLRRFFPEALTALREEVKKLSLFLLGMALLLLLNLLPGLGQLLYGVAAGAFTIFFLSAEYLGFVFSRKKVPFSAQRRYIFGRAPLMTGFGGGVLCLLAIPFLQMFCIPLAVVGATLLWCEGETGAGSTEVGS